MRVRRCQAVGAHWVSDCPTQGDPAYDVRRARPPLGIPMTRLRHDEAGGLVLPGGQTGTLVANEAAFNDVLAAMGLAGDAHQQQQLPQQQYGGAQPAAEQQQQAPLLLLDSKPAGEGGVPAAAAVKQEPGAGDAAALAAPAAAAAGAAAQAPLLAGEAELAGAPLAAAMPAAGFFTMVMQTALMPRGPQDLLRTAFDRPEPLARAGAPPLAAAAAACAAAGL